MPNNNVTRNSGHLLVVIIVTEKHSHFHVLSEIGKTQLVQTVDYSVKTVQHL